MAGIRIALLLLAGLGAGGPAQAETRIFLLKGSDDYGVDRCLAAGERCGEAAAAALCRARAYAQAVNFGRIDPNEITGAVPDGAQVAGCKAGGCRDLVAITCSR